MDDEIHKLMLVQEREVSILWEVARVMSKKDQSTFIRKIARRQADEILDLITKIAKSKYIEV